MNISSISSYTYKTPVSFKSRIINSVSQESTPVPIAQREPLLNGQYYLSTGTISKGATTGLFVRDIDWSAFAKYLQNRFANCQQVNTYDYGSADGSEAFSFAMMLDNGVDEPTRFYPIMARDITYETAIKLKNRHILFPEKEYEAAKRALELNDEEMKKYFIEGKNKAAKNRFKLNDEFRNNIEFKKANILDDVSSIDAEKPSLVMCRNMWPYINPNKYDNFAKELYKQLAVGSTVVIGGFDNIGAYKIIGTSDFHESLTKAGFKPVEDFEAHGAPILYEKN